MSTYTLLGIFMCFKKHKTSGKLIQH